jgi:hypothetical protein
MRRSTAIRLTVALAALFVWAGSARAQDAPKENSSGKKQRIVKAGKTVYDFDAVDITGNLKRPNQGSVVEAPDARFRRLLELDESFIPELIRSVDEF